MLVASPMRFDIPWFPGPPGKTQIYPGFRLLISAPAVQGRSEPGGYRLRAIQDRPGCRNCLEALDVKKHAQQTDMWTEDQRWIKDDFWNLELIPIQLG
jgi:hypothetical protein